MADFEKLFEENRGFIFKFLLKMSGDASLAEELTQETFFRAYMNLNSLHHEEKASSWLCSIAKNTYFAWCKSGKKSVPLSEADGKAQGGSIEETMVQKETTREIFQHLHALEEPYKEVFLLSVFGELSLKEISMLFKKSESWARVTFYRAKQKILERMKEKNEM